MTTPGSSFQGRFYKRVHSHSLGSQQPRDHYLPASLHFFTLEELAGSAIPEQRYLFSQPPTPFFLSKLCNPSREEPLPKSPFHTGPLVHGWMGDYPNPHRSSPADCSPTCLRPQLPCRTTKPTRYTTHSQSTHPHARWVWAGEF